MRVKPHALTLAAAIMVALSTLGVERSSAASLDINVRPVHLDPDRPSVDRVGKLRYAGGLRLTSRDRRFGGLSGLTFVGRDKLLAVSDRGWWVSFDIVEKSGRLIGIRDATIDPLRDTRGEPIKRNSDRDAEAVEIAADGSLVVSFERRHRLWRYPAPPVHMRGRAASLSGDPAWTALPNNGGFEAIAIGPGQHRLLVAERAVDGAANLAGWIFEKGRYRRLTYATVGLFAPTDFARLPSGHLLALERRFTAVGGFAGRLHIIDRATIRPGATLTGREIARLERPLQIENYEGIAVRESAGRPIRIYVISDDNYNPLQRTLLLAFELVE